MHAAAVKAKPSLTVALLVREAIMLLAQEVGVPSVERDVWDKDTIQYCVDLNLTADDLALPLDEFSRRYIVPAVNCLNDMTRHRPRMVRGLLNPAGGDRDTCALERFQGLEMRGVLHETTKKEQEMHGLSPFLLRLDICCEAVR